MTELTDEQTARIRGRGVPPAGRASARAHRRAEHRPDEPRRLLPQLPVELVSRRGEGGGRRDRPRSSRARSSTACPMPNGRPHQTEATDAKKAAFEKSKPPGIDLRAALQRSVRGRPPSTPARRVISFRSRVGDPRPFFARIALSLVALTYSVVNSLPPITSLAPLAKPLPTISNVAFASSPAPDAVVVAEDTTGAAGWLATSSFVRKRLMKISESLSDASRANIPVNAATAAMPNGLIDFATSALCEKVPERKPPRITR